MWDDSGLSKYGWSSKTRFNAKQLCNYTVEDKYCVTVLWFKHLWEMINNCRVSWGNSVKFILDLISFLI